MTTDITELAKSLKEAAEKELNFHENHGKGRSLSSQLRESKGEVKS